MRLLFGVQGSAFIFYFGQGYYRGGNAFIFSPRNLQISKQTLQVYLIYFMAFLKVCGFHNKEISVKKENPQGKLNFRKVNQKTSRVK